MGSVLALMEKSKINWEGWGKTLSNISGNLSPVLFFIQFFNKGIMNRNHCNLPGLYNCYRADSHSIALFAPDILRTVCSARGIRVLGMLFAVVGNPLGIENIYIGAVTPLIVMLINHIIGKNDCILQNDSSSISNKEGKVIKLVVIWT